MNAFLKGFARFIDENDIFVYAVILMLLPTLISGMIGGCVYNRMQDVSRGDLAAYATAVSNRLERVEFGLSLLAIPVQRIASETSDPVREVRSPLRDKLNGKEGAE